MAMVADFDGWHSTAAWVSGGTTAMVTGLDGAIPAAVTESGGTGPSAVAFTTTTTYDNGASVQPHDPVRLQPAGSSRRRRGHGPRAGSRSPSHGERHTRSLAPGIFVMNAS